MSPIPNESPHFFGDHSRRRDDSQDLTFFIKFLKKKHPEKSPIQVHDAIERALEEMSPSRNRTILTRITERILREGDRPIQ